MRLHHLNCGSMCPLGGALVDGHGSWLRPARLVCHCLLLATEDSGLVLIDTGLGTADVDHPHPRLSRSLTGLLRPRLRQEDTALAQVEALGYSRRDVRHIVLTHLDFDHAGGLQDFPQAVVHVYETELRAATRRGSWLHQRRYRAAQWEQDVQWQTYTAQGTPWFGFRAVRELHGLKEDILMVPLAGHTQGHCGVAVRGASGAWTLLAGDAYFHHDEMPSSRGQAPRCPPGLAAYQRFMEVDRASRLRNQQRLRELAVAHSGAVRIFCSHDAQELAHSRRQQTPSSTGERQVPQAFGQTA